MNYQIIDHTSNAFTSRYLQSIYVLRNGTADYIYGCAPNGEIGLSVIVAGESHMKVETDWLKQPSVSVYGLVKKMQFHRMGKNYHEINFGFKPQFLQLFLRDRLSILEEQRATECYELFQKHAVDQLQDLLSFASGHADVLAAIEQFLRVHIVKEQVDARVLAAHQLIMDKSIWKVEDLSQLLNISSTSLRQCFKEQVGISPKDLIKICRLKRVLNSQQHDEKSLTDMAYQSGYFDQAHFIHDFKKAIGITPKQYFSNQSLTFDFYNFNRWSYDSFAATKMF